MPIGSDSRRPSFFKNSSHSIWFNFYQTDKRKQCNLLETIFRGGMIHIRCCSEDFREQGGACLIEAALMGWKSDDCICGFTGKHSFLIKDALINIFMLTMIQM